ncbi:MAG: radical SAM protein [Phycisphaerae bacterium]|nr:radical SAM protein [Phycisphaerae bacterium]
MGTGELEMNETRTVDAPLPHGAASEGDNGNGKYDSRTEAPAHTTAHRIQKRYHPAGAVSDNPNKSSTRTDDGYVTSHEYGEQARAASGSTKQSDTLPNHRRHIESRYVDLDYHHPIEDILKSRLFQQFLHFISRPRPGRNTLIEEIIETYGDTTLPFWQHLKLWPFHLLIEHAFLRGMVSKETFRLRIAEHRSTVRGLVVTARSVAEYGLRLPQRFSAPLFAVWNFTNRCNLRCKHCYQDADHARLANELTLDERLGLVDQMGENYTAMIAFAGGEPLIDKDLFPVLHRCKERGIHTSIATNGVLITPEMAARLAEAGVKYVEVSLDSVHPERHDAFRGHAGMWERAVAGMRNVIAQDGLRLGIAMCVTRNNYDEAEDMIRFAIDIGANCFAYFNFIPVGRGLEMAEQDITPRQREELLAILNTWMQSKKISVFSTSPQFGRIALAYPPASAMQACSHLGGAGGTKARVVAKYVGGCGAGRCYVAIEPDGTITPCVYMPQRILGNIRQRRFIDIFRDNDFWDMLCDRDDRTHHCEVCEFKHYCGGCRARADAYYGQANAGDPGCIFNEKHWEALTAGTKA